MINFSPLEEEQLSHFPTPQFLTARKNRHGYVDVGYWKKTAAANYRVNAQGKEWEFLQIGNINKTMECTEEFSWHSYSNVQ